MHPVGLKCTLIHGDETVDSCVVRTQTAVSTSVQLDQLSSVKLVDDGDFLQRIELCVVSSADVCPPPTLFTSDSGSLAYYFLPVHAGADWAAWLPGTFQVGRLGGRPGGPTRQLLKYVERFTPLTVADYRPG